MDKYGVALLGCAKELETGEEPEVFYVKKSFEGNVQPLQLHEQKFLLYWLRRCSV